MKKNISLAIKETVQIKNLSITLNDIVFELIAADPFDEESRPSGSGASIYLTLKEGNESKDITLTELSEGYESELDKLWKHYQIHLKEVSDKGDNITLEIIYE